MKIIKLIKRTLNKKDIDFLIFFITSKCNSRCKHCFYWKNLNHKDDLTLTQIKKISETLPEIRDLSLSGGEPILRQDLLEIIQTFYKNNKLTSLSIPTNGLLPDVLEQTVKEIKTSCPNLKLLINFSLDGLEKTHDNFRGIKGNFKKVIKAIKQLQNYNIFININTVISNENYKELPELMNFVRTLDVDGHYFELLRGSPKDPVTLPPLKEIQRIHNLSLKNDEYYFNKKYNSNKISIKYGKSLTKLFYIGIVKQMYKTQTNFLKGKPWPFKCLAGSTSLVIEHNGDLKVCELLPKVLNLKDYNYNIKQALSSKEYQKAKQHTCYCTHNCFIYNSMNHSLKTRFIKIPLNYLRKWN